MFVGIPTCYKLLCQTLKC